MKITTPKVIVQKVFPLFLSLGVMGGILVLNPMEIMVKQAEARAAATGPRGGAAVSGPRGTAATGPRGGTAVSTPRGTAAVGPRGNAVAATPRSYVHSGTASGAAYVGPRGAAVRGPYGGTAVVRTVPAGARAVAIAGATYYVASGVYYRQVYQGSEVVYQQVPNPEGQ